MVYVENFNESISLENLAKIFERYGVFTVDKDKNNQYAFVHLKQPDQAAQDINGTNNNGKKLLVLTHS